MRDCEEGREHRLGSPTRVELHQPTQPVEQISTVVLEPLAHHDSPAPAIPKPPSPGINALLLPHDPLPDETCRIVVAVPDLPLQPRVDLVDSPRPPRPRLRRRVVLLRQVPPQRDVRAGHDVARVDVDARGPGEVERVPADFCARVRVRASATMGPREEEEECLRW